MKFEHVCGFICGAAILGTLAVAGPPAPDAKGKKCPNGGAETQDGDSGKDNSDPINLSIGGFQHQQYDLVLPGIGLDFEFKRLYRSYGGLQAQFPAQTYQNGNSWALVDYVQNEAPLGYHWDFNYNIRISFDGINEPNPVPAAPEMPAVDPGDGLGAVSTDQVLPDEILLFSGDGRMDAFTRYSPVGDRQPGGDGRFSNIQLRQRIDYTFRERPVRLTDQDLTVYTFLPAYSISGDILPFAGRLGSITDRNGNEIVLHWEVVNTGADEVQRIDYVTDTRGEEIDFVYHDEFPGGAISPHASESLRWRSQLIWQVVDRAERAFEYQYDFTRGFPVLASVTSPSIVSDSYFPLPSEHERFVGGRTWEYTYDNSDDVYGPWRGKLLSTVKSPNGQVVIENQYYDSPLFDRNEGRVYRQKYGGFEYNYIVTDLDGSIDLPTGETSSAKDDYYVWVNDRNGAITRFLYAGREGITNPDAFHRQLIEKVEYEGFVDHADRSVWYDFVNQGWVYLDEANHSPLPYTAPKLSDGTLATEEYVETWETNGNWDVTTHNQPNGNSSSQDPWRAENSGNFAGQITDDPLLWGAVENRTFTSASGTESITEQWRYDFAFSGGCGCGAADFATAYKDGNGYVTVREFDENNGNLLAVFHDLPVSTDIDNLPINPEMNAAAVDRYTYNSNGQVLSHTHPKRFRLKPDGSEVNDSRIDTFEYYSDPSDLNNYGRLKKKIVDSGTSVTSGESLTTVYEYDAAGNVIRATDPRGDIIEYLYNQASELVQEVRFDNTGTNRYSQIDYFYDANGNVVREEIMNLDHETNLVASNPSISTVYSYDDLDFLTGKSSEAGVFDLSFMLVGGMAGDGSGRYLLPETDDLFVTQKWAYDGGKNLILFSDGESVNGIDDDQLSNITEYEYDARDLRVKAIQGSGEDAPRVVDYEYDTNGRLSRTIVDPAADTDSDPDTMPQSTELAYDAFDRVVKRTDPMGNEYFYEYDKNHNMTEVLVCGPVDFDDHLGTQDQSALAILTREYGPLDLMEEESFHVFDYSYGSSGGNGFDCENFIYTHPLQTTTFEYNQDSSLKRVLAPSGQVGLVNETLMYYDTVSRLETLVDGAGNNTEYDYDADSNVIRVWQFDVSSSGLVSEEFEVLYEYDPMHRRTATVDGVSNRTEIKYDSRSNIVERKDARNHIQEFAYDSLSRLVQTTTKMDPNGTPYDIVEQKSYDASSRLVSETDDNGNETLYTYDGLNRLTKITMPDGEFYTAAYDFTGNAKTYTDARGVVVTQTFDRNNRLTTRTMSGTSVPGAISESYTYDGLGRLRTAENDSTKITREYDSRSNITREIQNYDPSGAFLSSSDRIVSYAYDDASNVDQIVYPGGRVIDRTHDEFNRLSEIISSDLSVIGVTSPITQFEYIGRRLASRVNGNGTRTDYTYNGIEDGNGGVTNAAGDFGFGRVSSITTTDSVTTSVLDKFEFAWDDTQNRIKYDDVGSNMKNRRERAFGYDAANRLISTDIDYLDPLTDHTAPTNNGVTAYTLDGVHNRTDVSGYSENGAPIGAYSQSGSQAQNNQYTLTPREAGGEWTYLYDENGNLIAKGENSEVDFNGDFSFNYNDISSFLAAYSAGDMEADFNGDGTLNFHDISAFNNAFGAVSGTGLENWEYSYDFRNQLIDTRVKDGGLVLSKITNTYDPAARRVVESIDLMNNGVDESCQYVYGCSSLWEVIEQIDLLTDETLMTHVYGLGIDDEVSYRIEDLLVDENIWSHRDDLNSLTSISDENGVIVERYEYGDYGKVSYFDAAGMSLPATQFKAQHLYTGRSLISGTGLYDYRFRVMEPESGRFMQRDPLGYVESMSLYAYVSSSPYVHNDPYGLFPPPASTDTGIPWIDSGVYTFKIILGIRNFQDDVGIYVKITSNSPGEKSGTIDGFTHDPNVVIEAIEQQGDQGKCISEITISSHHRTYPDGKGEFWAGGTAGDDDDLVNSLSNLCDGATVNLKMCNSGGLAAKIKNKYPGKNIKVNHTDGQNRNVPGTKFDIPGGGSACDSDGCSATTSKKSGK